MAPESSREREIFLGALECSSTTACGRYLETACGGDFALRRLVESLLEHHRPRERTPMLPHLQAFRAAEGQVHAPGSVVDRYRLVREIGRGGCGIVYLAEQEAPVRRQVALKVLRLGMRSRAVVARFEVERQTLALMEHPNIARLFDAGETSSGDPYFVMEWVRGEPLTRYCDRQRLRVAQRLELLIQVCRAVEHAHQRGIIHRDLKPSNILVAEQDGRAVPRVIDFGIARAIQSETDAVPEVQGLSAGGFLGTPAYMSPEQRRDGPVDTRADVYSLGVILYELVTGSPPETGAFAAGLPPGGAENPSGPPAPSERWNALSKEQQASQAERMGTSPARLFWELRGDLDLIARRALALDREARYSSVGDLARDLERMLAHRPIGAREDSILYRTSKLVRRHHLAVAMMTALILVFATGGGLLAWQYVQADWALKRAELAELEERVGKERLKRVRAAERRFREAAREQAASAQHQAYRADINLAQTALAANNLGRAVSLLRPYLAEVGSNRIGNWEWRYLWNRSRSEAIQTLGVLSNEVVRLAVSEEGRWVVARSLSGQIRIWDRIGGGEPATLAGASGETGLALASSPDGVRLARSRSEPDPDGGVRNVIEVQYLGRPGKPIQVLSSGKPVVDLWFAPGARSLVSVDSEGVLSSWDLESGTATPLAVAESPRRFAPQYSLSRDQALLAYAARDGQFRVVETATGRERFRGRLPVGPFRILQLSPDGRHLAVAGGVSDSEVVVWDVESARQEGVLRGHSAWIAQAVFLPDGRQIATAGADQTIRLWDLATGEQTRIFRGHELEVWSVAVSGDGRFLVSGSKDGLVNLWDLTRPPRPSDPWISEETVLNWTFPSGTRAVLTLSPEGRVFRRRLDRLEDRDEVLSLGPGASSTVFSADGRFVAGTHRDRGIELWSLDAPALAPDVLPIPQPAIPVAFVGDGNLLVTWNPSEGRFRVWDHSAKESLLDWAGRNGRFPGSFGPVAVSGDRIATLDPFGGPWVRNVSSDVLKGYPPTQLSASGMALSPDGRSLALSSRNGVTRLWRFDSAVEPLDIRGFLLGTHGVAFTADGTRLAVASSGHEAIKLFSVDTGEELLTLESPEGFLWSPAFSGDGEWLGASAPGGRLQMWRAPIVRETDGP